MVQHHEQWKLFSFLLGQPLLPSYFPAALPES